MPESGSQARKMRFGPYELDEAARELRKNGLSIRIQDQPWEVLRALVERPGEVVSREELRRRLWPDGTFVDYEQSLNKAVNKLREALCDSADHPRYVETLARRGYRFIAPVEIDASAEPPSKAPAALPRPPVALPPPNRKPRLWFYALAALPAVALITGLWPAPQPRSKVTPITTGARDKSLNVLVAGGRVFYAASELGTRSERYELWSVPVTGGEARQEASPCPPDGFGSTPAGVSYARKMLLLACSPAPFKVELWLAGFDGGNHKRIGQFDLGEQSVSLSPDLQTLLFGRKEGIFARPVEGGPERLVARVEGLEIRSDEPQAPPPFFHPDGARITLQRVVDGHDTIWEIRADGTGLRPLLPRFEFEQKDARWSPDGRRLYFISRGDIYVQAGRGWLGWMRRPAPVRLTAGPTQFEFPQEAPDDPQVVYAVGRVRQVEPAKLNRKTNVWEPFLGGLPADCINYSPDRQWIVYVSWPGGELWKCRADGSSPVLLEDGLFTFTPRWSPDGTRIAFSARPRGVANAAQPFRIYTIAAAGGKPEPVPGVAGPAHDAVWSPDGKRLAFAPFVGEAAKEHLHVSIVTLETGAVESVPGSDGLFSVRWSPDGKWLAALNGKIWPVAYSFATRKWTPLMLAHAGYPHWSNDSRYLYVQTWTPVLQFIRIEVPSGRVEVIRQVTEFKTAGVASNGSFWTPDEEPVVLKDLTATQVYRIERDR